ncbi:IgA peptidase M64 [Idiomarina loihiensis]|uniref:peptidase n=1 Tax=Idiomarina TaxID=135575 RepID=UPI000D70C9BE|nr:peptidase [Idiomarina]PWW41485.1 IgA peptidase M64 [Idiomarina loihiensis]TDP50543.1 IgA peptidase M64 [Idiomarina loihiensis]TDS25179.1 IgA peptidase M64 [Idiomarina sp. H2]
MKAGLLIVLFLLALSGWSHQVHNHQQELSRLAHQGNARAQNQLANHHWKLDNRTAAYYWWQRSAKQHYFPAIESLIDEFPRANDTWLELAVAAGDPAAQRQVASAELTDQKTSINQWQNRWGDSREPWLQSKLELIERYKNNGQCDMEINVVAADSGEKRRYLNFLSAVQNAPFDTQNWCISFTLDESLFCVTDTQRKRASCRSEQQFDKQVILAEEGIASANSQTLTLTRDSSEAVIQHELGHWLGFADEYEMSDALAQKFCYGYYDHDSLNIIVTEAHNEYSVRQVKAVYKSLPWKAELSSWQDIATQKQGKWRLGSSKEAAVGLFKTDTCNAIDDRQAWRPVNVRTAMEQHDTKLWPEVYLRLLKQKTEAFDLDANSDLGQD